MAERTDREKMVFLAWGILADLKDRLEEITEKITKEKEKKSKSKKGKGRKEESSNLCACGCGEEVKKGRRYIQGHSLRMRGKVKKVKK